MRALILLGLAFAPFGLPDSLRVSLPINAGTTGPWHVAKAAVEVPKDAMIPKLISAPQTAQPKVTPASSVSISFEIDEKGVPVNVQVDKSSDKELDDEVIAMIREWRFEAALRGGTPVVTHAYVELSGGDLSAGPGRKPPPRRRPAAAGTAGSPAQQ